VYVASLRSKLGPEHRAMLETALVQVGVISKTMQNPQQAPAAAGGSTFSIYSGDRRTLVQAPRPAVPGKAPQQWVEPPQQLLAAATFNSRDKRQPDAQPLTRQLKLVGLGSLNGPNSNQQVISGPRGEVMLTVVPLNGDRLLAMETSLTDVDAVVQADLLIFSLAAGATLVATAVLAIWLTSRSLAPLGRVSTVAGEIKAGAYDRRTGLRGNDQVANLAIAFDQMVDRLQEQIALEREAEARTRRFLADASRELRTPMAALLGHVEVLRRGASRNPADHERSLSATHTAALRMSKLLRDMLEIARLEQPELILRQDRIEVAGLVTQAAQTAQSSTGRHHVRIDHVDKSLLVVGDGDALARIIVNLLDNAARYSPTGTLICVRAETSSAGEIEIAVTDQGPGIATEEQERVFERLYRGEHARDTSGAGLGLAICQALARHHGGDVSVRSEPENGSTFVLRLPPAW
jgi:two-component system, OmpR family, sensor histidine kinase TrcS